jgi:Glycosyl transferases group 1
MDALEPRADRWLRAPARRSYAVAGLIAPTNTLLLYAANVPSGWRRLVADTINARIGLRVRHLPRALRDNARAQFLVAQEYEILSYVPDWKEAFERSPMLRIETCDVDDAWAVAKANQRMRGYELIIVMHSAAGDDLTRIRTLRRALQRRRGKLLILFGNEYSLLQEKIQFAKDTGAEFIGTQLPIDSGTWLYQGLNAQVVAAPPALNPYLYRPLSLDRRIDVGFRGVRYANPFGLGDLTRERTIDFFKSEAGRLNLRVDIEFTRLPRVEWARFLNTCRCVVGAESGTSYLERDDALRNAIGAYVAEHPGVPFEQVFGRFFAGREASMSGKAVSSRHFEPLGTETLQLLVEGHYNGLLEAGVHYVPLKRDLSNVQEALHQVQDESYRRAMSVAAREYALDSHTYDHRVADLLRRCLV